jgi:hypothetical protein
MAKDDEEYSAQEAQRRTEAAIRASFTLAPKAHKEMAGQSGRPSRKRASKPVKDSGET